MRNLIERIFKRDNEDSNYIIGKYKPSHAQAGSKPESWSEYDVEVPNHDEMDIDNIYKKL